MTNLSIRLPLNLLNCRRRRRKEEATPVVQPPVQQEPELNVRTPDKNALEKSMSRYKQAEAPQKTSELSMSQGQ
jgi:hypothetical protein